MAEEVKRIIEVEAKYESLADLQAEVNKAKAALDDMMSTQLKGLRESETYQNADLATKRELTKAVKDQTKASSDYQLGLTAVKRLTSEYNAQMRMSAKEYASVDDGMKVVKGSYNDLVNQLARLKESWKNAVPGTDQYMQITQEVNKVKGQLETMDHSIGNWQRNVGNYQSAWKGMPETLGRISPAAGRVVQSAKQVDVGFKMLSANPIVGIITILVSLLTKLVQGMKNSEAASMRMAEALAPLKGAGQLVSKVFEGFANVLAKGVEWLGKMADKLGLVSERAKENAAIVKESNALKLREREILVENSKLELEAAQARNIAADKARVSVQDRIKALEKAEAAEKQILANELEIAQKKFDLAKREAALAPNDSAMNDRLAQSEAELYRVRTSYEQGMRRIIAQHSEALREMGRATAAAVKEASTEVAKVSKGTGEDMSQALLQAASKYEKGSEEYLRKMVAARTTILRTMEKKEGETEVQFQARRLAAQEALEDAKLALAKNRAQAKLDALKLSYLQEGDIEDNRLQLAKDIAKQELDNILEIGRLKGESQEAYLLRMLEAQQKYEDAVKAIEVKSASDTEAHNQKRIKDARDYAAAVSSILDSVAGAYQNEIKAQVDAGKISEQEGEKQFENVKGLQYAVTWINTLSAVVGALAEPGLPWLMKATNATTALTTGIANTIKIANTTLGSTQTSSATGQGVQSATAVQTAAPPVQIAVPEYRTLTTANDERTLNERAGTQKVVLVTSELEAYQQGRRVTLAESTF